MTKEFGRVTKETDGYKVKFERDYPHSAAKVWDAITDPERLKIWFAEMEMEFRPGGRLVIYFEDEERTATYGQIITIQPPRLFEFSWEGELASWEVIPKGENACKLLLTYSRLADTYAASVPAGFHLLLDQLETVLNGRTEPYPFGAGETEESRAMMAKYEEMVFTAYPELKQKAKA